MESEALNQSLRQQQIMKAQQDAEAARRREQARQAITQRPELAGPTESGQPLAGRSMIQRDPVGSAIDLFAAGDIQGAKFVSGLVEEADSGAFGGTGVGQFYNKYIDILPKIVDGSATPQEQLIFQSAKRELSQPKIVGSAETGFTAIPRGPLPGGGAVNPGLQPGGAVTQSMSGASTIVDPNRMLSKTEREGLRDDEGNLPPFGMTVGQVMDPNSQYKTMSSRDSERIFQGKSALGLVDSLEELSGLGTEESLFKGFDNMIDRAKVSATNFSDYLGGQNTRLSTYVDSRNAVKSLLVRALGEKGALSNQDIMRIDRGLAQLFPLPDSEDAAREKFQFLRNTIKEIQGRQGETSVSPRTGSGVPKEGASVDELINFYSSQ
jgi:hypothetical protein